jgi:hypothetical protein
MQLKRKIFIVGDSYCYYRTDPDAHWPARLSRNLGLELRGSGFPGEGWWPVRKSLLDYSQTSDFDQTELFVFCHTQPSRALTSNPNFHIGLEQNKNFYLKFIQSNDVDSWTVSTWYNELNTLLAGKRVIHLPSFEHNEFQSILLGYRLLTPLLNISILSAGGNLFEHDWGGSTVKTKMNSFHNHFSPKENVNFGDFITHVVTRRPEARYSEDVTYDAK